jgi:chromatin segregation and condensation protein Rec8/ScpA/Scc1 (kleisin family)
MKDKTPEELIALLAAAIHAEMKAKAGLGQQDKTTSEAREDVKTIGQELLRRLQAGEIAEKKLQKIAELARAIKPNQKPLT